jgi:hypothetical protein
MALKTAKNDPLTKRESASKGKFAIYYRLS